MTALQGAIRAFSLKSRRSSWNLKFHGEKAFFTVKSGISG